MNHRIDFQSGLSRITFHPSCGSYPQQEDRVLHISLQKLVDCLKSLEENDQQCPQLETEFPEIH